MVLPTAIRRGDGPRRSGRRAVLADEGGDLRRLAKLIRRAPRRRPCRAKRWLDANDAAWHAAMGARPDPKGAIGKQAPTWERMHEICAGLMARWEAWPEAMRRGYAFPNPEDRR